MAEPSPSLLCEEPQAFPRAMASCAQRELFSADAVNDGRHLRSTTSPSSKIKRTITVRPKAMLSTVLAEAGLPEVKYKTSATYRGRVGATAYLWTSQNAGAGHMMINGDPAMDANEAMQNAATQCLEHLQDTMHIELDCPQLQKIKTDMKYLSSSVAEKDKKIVDLKTKVEKKNLQVMGLSKGWGSLADDLLGSAGRIDKMAVNYMPTGSSPVEGDVAWDCYYLTQEADNLCYLSSMSTYALKTIGNYPYDNESDNSEYDDLLGYYPSDHEDQDNGSCSPDLEGVCGGTCFYDEFLYDACD